jgi:hypothetical protein
MSFLLASLRSMTKIAGSGSISQRHGSADPDPDPPQNVMDPEHCQKHTYGAGSATMNQTKAVLYYFYRANDIHIRNEALQWS